MSLSLSIYLIKINIPHRCAHKTTKSETKIYRQKKRSITQNSLNIAIREKKMFTKMSLSVLTINQP